MLEGRPQQGNVALERPPTAGIERYCQRASASLCSLHGGDPEL